MSYHQTNPTDNRTSFLCVLNTVKYNFTFAFSHSIPCALSSKNLNLITLLRRLTYLPTESRINTNKSLLYFSPLFRYAYLGGTSVSVSSVKTSPSYELKGRPKPHELFIRSVSRSFIANNRSNIGKYNGQH